MPPLGKAAQIGPGIIGETAGFGILDDQPELGIQFQSLGFAAQDRLINLLPALGGQSQTSRTPLDAHRKDVDALPEPERKNKVVGGNAGKLIPESGGVEELLPVEIPGHPPVGSGADENLAFLRRFDAGEGPHNLLGGQLSEW